ncbi:MAG: ATP-binding protein [Anaerolineae bacterium]|nr:ATP-binding protein [Anaerolineae bacterium]
MKSLSLAAKLAIAFVAVALVSVALVAVLANRVTAQGFARYLSAEQQAEYTALRADLEQFYARRGSWDGVVAVFGTAAPGRGQGQGQGQGQGAGGRFLTLFDAAGSAQYTTIGQGQHQTAWEPDIIIPLEVDGRRVGTLEVAFAGPGSQAGQQFLDTVNAAIRWAGVLAVAVALVLAIVLARYLTRPLRQLSEAAQQLAAGDLAQQVPVRSADELGELAANFNQMARALDSAEKQRRQLLADTAHDLRTPISVIQSHLEAMLDGVFPATPENLGVIHEETVLLSRLVNDVRTLSLAEAGQLPLDLQPLDLGAAAEQAVAAFQPLAEADGIVLTLQREPVGLVSADAARMQQVFANLLANALRHAPQGKSEMPAVAVHVWQQHDAVHVAISDNGPGLSAEQQQHVFDRFWRSDHARNRSNGGSGLGLAIVHGVIIAHGGDITVASELGHGARFSFFLPVT